MKIREVAKGQYTFWCPGCDTIHGFKTPGWTWNGDFNKPTVSPSLKTTHGKGSTDVCHCYIKAGQIQFLSDCTHALKGKTVDILDLPEWAIS